MCRLHVESSFALDSGGQVQPDPEPDADQKPALYVAPNGSPTGSCTRSSPCTLARADAIVTPATTVHGPLATMPATSHYAPAEDEAGKETVV